MLEDLSLLRPELWGADDEGDDTASAAAAEAVWRPVEAASPFLCAFKPPRRRATRRGGRSRADVGPPPPPARSAPSVGRIRMAWGTVQEATSILAALNYFGRYNATVEEAGLQPLEALPPAERAQLPAGLPPIGASPDAIVRWPDGRVEPFEVKNHAPFASSPRYAREAGAPPLQVRDPGPYDEVAVWHVPQLYLHMLCLGEACSSALFMSASATRGVNVFRLHRDEALMHAMLRFVAYFHAEYGGGRHPPPPPDYLWGAPGYAELLEGLQRASREQVELVAHIPDAEVQRGTEGRFFED